MIKLVKILLGRAMKSAEKAEMDPGLAASNFVRSIDVAGRVLRRHFWIWPVIAFLLLATVGYFVNLAIRNSLEARIRSELQTLLHVECSMLEKWLKKQEENASAIASNPEIVTLVRRLVELEQPLTTPSDATSGNPVQATELSTNVAAEAATITSPLTPDEVNRNEELNAIEIRLRQLLLPGMAARRFTNFLILGADYKILSMQRRESGVTEIPAGGIKFFKTVLEEGARVSHPFPSLSMQMDSKGVVRGDVPVMRVAVPIFAPDAPKVDSLAKDPSRSKAPNDQAGGRTDSRPSDSLASTGAEGPSSDPEPKPASEPGSDSNADTSLAIASHSESELAPEELSTKGPQAIALLTFMIRPDREFTRILKLGKLGNTGETYAINDVGLLISESRFNDELKLSGLIPDQEGARSLLNIYVKDPGGDLSSGYRPKQRRSELPLTHAAESVIKGESNVSLDGHRNYRGVPSVAAWKWLKGYNIGVITEMTTAEAFGPLTILQRVFYFIFALLTITFAALMVFSLVLSKIRQEARDAAIEAKQLGQYRLDTLLGKGAMGEVYKGQHSTMRRPTAIKLLKSDLVSDNAIERFEHEVQLTCKLNNPNTVAIYDYGRTPDGVFYYAMEYLEGINLQSLVERYGPQPMGRVIHILTQISGSLYEAHSLGLVHRDIKPANIMINRRGGECDVVKVLDFGLVRSVTEVDEPDSDRGMAGTPMYMSPEAIQYPKSVDVRSDIYSLGAVGYFLLTGEPLYQVNSLGELFQQHIEMTPESPSVRAGVEFPEALDQAIMACLQKSRSSRPQTAKEFANRLRAIEVDEPWTRTEAESWWIQYDRETQEESNFEQHVSSLYGSNAALRSRVRATTKRLNKPKTMRSYDATIGHESDDQSSDGS